MRHHDAALARYAALAAGDPGILAVVVAGSVARGTERADSDVDLYVVVDDAAFSRALHEDRIMYVSDRDVDYPGGYFDIKLITPRMLDLARASADEPMRASLRGARVVYRELGHSELDGLDELLAQVAAGPRTDGGSSAGDTAADAATTARADADARVGSYLAQARLHGGYFLVQGIEHGDPLLTAHAAVHLAFAAGRAFLADAGVPFSGPKYLHDTVAGLPNAPHGYADALLQLVTHPSAETADAVMSPLEERLGDRLTEEATLTRFVYDNELAWYTKTSPPEYR